MSGSCGSKSKGMRTRPKYGGAMRMFASAELHDTYILSCVAVFSLSPNQILKILNSQKNRRFSPCPTSLSKWNDICTKKDLISTVCLRLLRPSVYKYPEDSSLFSSSLVWALHILKTPNQKGWGPCLMVTAAAPISIQIPRGPFFLFFVSLISKRNIYSEH